MPELPEVECVRRSLLRHVQGRTVSAVALFRRDVARSVNARGEDRRLPPRGAEFQLLEGVRIVDVRRHGKQLALISEPPRAAALVVHLGMSGQLFCLGPGAPIPDPSHIHVRWQLDTGARLFFRDPRRFGGVWAVPGPSLLEKRWADLGPDALTITADELAARLGRTRRAIKSALLDQRLLAGVGNIYVDESLFAARILPSAISSSLRAPHVERLASAIRAVLTRAIDSGGSSLSDGMYLDADGRQGTYQLSHSVYGRGGQPCPECRTSLSTGLLAGRTTVWCRRCQGSGARR